MIVSTVRYLRACDRVRWVRAARLLFCGRACACVPRLVTQTRGWYRRVGGMITLTQL